MHFACGLVVGLTGLAAGYCIGIVGDNGVRAYMKQSKVYVGMILILIFGEVLGLYGYTNYGMILAPRLHKLISYYNRLIVALLLNSRSKG